ncbi:MAG: hypothetical protein JWM90_2998 [Thermoleophilia bacterium]|nr:hypothetical protein [Thermoleophilia bacterium]
MSDLWRTKLRSVKPGVNHERQVAYCIEREVIGIGWGMDRPSGTALDDVLAVVRNDWNLRTAAHTIRRFAEAKDGEFIWTRDTFGRYRLCRLEGPWRYENDPESAAVDIHQVRDVSWMTAPANDLQVPGAVIRCFVGTGSSFSRVRNKSARMLTERIWAMAAGAEPEPLGFSPSQVLADMLDPYDVEDLIYVWLQVTMGYIALPRSRKRDTPVYEFSMLHAKSGRRGIVQVKTGRTPVDIDGLAKALDSDTDAFAFATSGRYAGADSRVSVISENELLEFVAEHPQYLPERIRWMFELAT